MTLRAMPVRDDHWQPEDRIYAGLLRRCAADADAAESRDGTSELMAGALILAVLAVVIISVAESAEAAILICGVLAAAVFGYVVTRGRPPRGERRVALRALGGAGRLPAGFLVHPAAWEAGMAEHVVHLPESQLRAAAELCRRYPGTVDDLIVFVGNLAIHEPVTRPLTSPHDVDRRARALVRRGMPLLIDYLKSAPPLPTPPPLKGKGRKR